MKKTLSPFLILCFLANIFVPIAQADTEYISSSSGTVNVESTQTGIVTTQTGILVQTAVVIPSGSTTPAEISTGAVVQTGIMSQTGSAIDTIISLQTGAVNNTDTGAQTEEEQDDADITLADDRAELDSQKDFTAVIRQSKEYTCGPASLATLMTQLGNDTGEEEVLSHIQDLSPEKGVSLSDLRQAAEKLGQKTYLKKWDTETILGYINRTNDPVLIHDEKKGVGGHFSVIKSYDADKNIVELSDTEAGNIKYSVEDFRHIYTKDVLVISEDANDELLNNKETDISDEEALAIWGKYVPVAVYAQNNGNTTAANDFRICQNKALALVTAAQRNIARKACYDALGKSLGTNMDNSSELKFGVSYDISNNPFNNDNLGGEFGLTNIMKILNDKLQANRAALSTRQSLYNSKISQYNTTINENPTLKNKVNLYNKSLSDKVLLQAQFNQKQTVYISLNNEINGGVFVQNGQTFSLGAVGNQVTAQSSNYARLSSSLSSRLANIDGQIRQAQSQLSNAQYNYSTWSSRYTSYNSDYISYFATAQKYLGLYNTTKTNKQSNLNSYVYYLNLANTANKNRDEAINGKTYWGPMVYTYTSQITSLQSQKSSSQSEINAASAELARLQRLKTFGDQEIARKKGLLSTLTNELLSLLSQLTVANNNISSLPTEIATIRTNLEKTNIGLKNEIDILKDEIDALTREITNEQQEIANEASNEKAWDNSAESTATQDIRNSISQSLSYAKNNPGQVVLIAGGAIVYVGASAACVAYTAGACAPFIEVANSALISYTIYDSANSASKILTQRDLFGNEVSDTEWGNALTNLELNGVLGIASVASLKTSVLSSKTPTVAKGLINRFLYGSSAEKSGAITELESIMKAVRGNDGFWRIGGGAWKIISRAGLPKNVQDSLLNLEKTGWKRSWQGQANGAVWENRLNQLPSNTTYTEWDVFQVTPRGANRFVKSADGSVYFTSDHYDTFLKIQ